MCIPTPAELTAIGSFIKDITISCAAIITAIVAWRGLNKWQDETTFKARFELAKEVLETTYKMNNLVKDLRMIDYNLGYDGSSFYNDLYLKPLREFNEHYQTLTVASKALFGDNVENKLNHFRELIDCFATDILVLLVSLDDIQDVKASIKNAKKSIKNGNSSDKSELENLEKNYKELLFDIDEILKTVNTCNKSVESLEKSNRIDKCINDVADCMTSHLKR
jgi:hypothetical protein